MIFQNETVSIASQKAHSLVTKFSSPLFIHCCSPPFTYLCTACNLLIRDFPLLLLSDNSPVNTRFIVLLYSIVCHVFQPFHSLSYPFIFLHQRGATSLPPYILFRTFLSKTSPVLFYKFSFSYFLWPHYMN